MSSSAYTLAGKYSTTIYTRTPQKRKTINRKTQGEGLVRIKLDWVVVRDQPNPHLEQLHVWQRTEALVIIHCFSLYALQFS